MDASYFRQRAEWAANEEQGDRDRRRLLRCVEVFVVVVGSYALLKVLRTVGEAALRVSRRSEAALPKMRGWWVLTVSLGRSEERAGIIGSEVAMVDCRAGDDEKAGGAGWDDIVESIMGETCRTPTSQVVGADRGSVAGMRQPCVG